MSPARALLRRALADARVRTLIFAAFFVFYFVAIARGYAHEFPTAAERESFARAFSGNPALELFYGAARNPETIGGYTAWRAGGILSIVAGFFGLWSAVKMLRGEEDTGRFDLVLAGAISRGSAFTVRIAAIGVLIAGLWLASMIGLLAGGLPFASSILLAIAIISTAVVYAGVGAVTSQVASSSRGALGAGAAILIVDLVIRTIADTTRHTWLRWIMPLGWVEQVRAFTGGRPLVLLIPFAVAILLLVVATQLDRQRDTGAGLIASRDHSLLSWLHIAGSTARLALREELISIAVWFIAVSGFGLMIGALSLSVTTADLGSVEQQLSNFGTDLSSVSGFLGLYFLFFVLAIAYFCCSQIGAMRDAEARDLLETLFALPVSRTRWMVERLLIAVAAAVALALGAGLGTAIGATIVGADVSYRSMLEAGLNCLPTGLLFLGVGALLIALVPRWGSGVAYGLVSLAFIWELVGDLVGVPSWMLGISPFHHIGLIPAQSFRLAPAAIMLAIGTVAAIAALYRFRSRDLAVA